MTCTRARWVPGTRANGSWSAAMAARAPSASPSRSGASTRTGELIAKARVRGRGRRRSSSDALSHQLLHVGEQAPPRLREAARIVDLKTRQGVVVGGLELQRLVDHRGRGVGTGHPEVV